VPNRWFCAVTWPYRHVPLDYPLMWTIRVRFGSGRGRGKAGAKACRRQVKTDPGVERGFQCLSQHACSTRGDADGRRGRKRQLDVETEYWELLKAGVVMEYARLVVADEVQAMLGKNTVRSIARRVGAIGRITVHPTSTWLGWR
jgi:hypothetical protein